MKCLGQIVQAIVFVLVVLSFFAYVSDQPESTTKPIGNPEEVFAACMEPDPRYSELRDPNHICVPTLAQVPQRQREHDRDRALAVGRIELP
jgi:hypothetical protein